jgi:hypothetical protein
MTFDNEIDKVKSEIKVLQSKLEFLEELENTKTPAEEAYKRIYGAYPMGEPFWVVFKKGYEAHQSLVEDVNKNTQDTEPESNDWKTVALNFGELLSSVGPNGYYNMTADQWLEWAKNTYTSLPAMEESPPPPEVTTENVLLKAYKATFGKYPTVGSSASEFDIQSWNIFQYGYKFGCGELHVEEIENHKDTEPYCPDEPEYYDEIEHDISENIQNNTIRDVIDRWWMDTFTSKNMSSVNECIDDLCDRIKMSMEKPNE